MEVGTIVTLEDVFGQGGLLSKTFPQHEYREGQLKMASTVLESLADKSHAAVQAGTGLGKTFSYLIPAILHAIQHKQRIVVSTGTINLQTQIVTKDIPALKQVLGSVADFEAILVKGRNNYLCRRKIESIQGIQTGFLRSLDDVDQWQKLLDWYRSGQAKKGDLEELPFRPNETLWSEVGSEQDLCLRKECPYQSECFFYRARARQKEAQILVTNHALFFADLAIRREQEFKGEQAVLESYDAVVFDEAQSIEDMATEFYSTEVTLPRVTYLINGIRAGLRPGGSLQWSDESTYRRFDGLGGLLFEKAERFFDELARQFQGQTVRLREKGLIEDSLSSELFYLRDELKGLASASQTDEQRIAILAFADRANRIGSDIESICQMSGGETQAYWVEANLDQPHRSRIASAPISLAQELQESLFNRVPTVLTSATLSSELLKRVGLTTCKAVRLESPYDYTSQAVLYVATDGPEPKDGEAFDSFTAQRVLELVQLSQGRAFVLFTSYRSMQSVYSQCEPVLRAWNYQPMMQGELRREELLRRFKENGHATLFAVASFWEGVDVVGEALSLVILVKLPFAVPSEPIIQARMEALEHEGLDPFNSYTLPQAVLRLKQGFGRLIRSKTDRGVIAILDRRVLTKSYGQVFLKALPPARRTPKLDDVKAFFAVKQDI